MVFYRSFRIHEFPFTDFDRSFCCMGSWLVTNTMTCEKEGCASTWYMYVLSVNVGSFTTWPRWHFVSEKKNMLDGVGFISSSSLCRHHRLLYYLSPMSTGRRECRYPKLIVVVIGHRGTEVFRNGWTWLLFYLLSPERYLLITPIFPFSTLPSWVPHVLRSVTTICCAHQFQFNIVHVTKYTRD
jgi:hypothetical protein